MWAMISASQPDIPHVLGLLTPKPNDLALSARNDVTFCFTFSLPEIQLA
jgi:hypothetical protein